MKKYTILMFALLSICMTSNGQVTRPPKQANAGAGRMYNPNTVVQIEGRIKSITRVPSRGAHEGIHLSVQTATQTIDVHLGPSWYVEGQGMKLEQNDFVQITGSQVTYGGSKIIVASKVMKDNKTLELRDQNGFPLWSRGRR